MSSSAAASGSSGGTSSSSAGSSSSSSQGPGCGAAVWDPANATCNQCVENACCQELLACDTGTPCDVFKTCIGACAAGDTACRAACEAASPAGPSALRTLQDCFGSNCASDPACLTPICDSGLLTVNAACGTCLGANCCAVFSSCTQETACVDCLMDPTNATCTSNASYTETQTCQTTSCAADCTNSICDSGLGYADNPGCNACLGNACCVDIKACAADQACMACLTGQAPMDQCTSNALLQAFNTCQTTQCPTQCQ